MSEAEDSGFIRKVLRFMASPVTELAGLSSAAPAAARTTSGTVSDASSPPELDRAELQIMLERKRRNDFVRKQELDLLRQIRRAGLNAAKLQALREGKPITTVNPAAEGTDPAAQTKLVEQIDQLEQELVPEGPGTTRSPGSRLGQLLTRPQALGDQPTTRAKMPSALAAAGLVDARSMDVHSVLTGAVAEPSRLPGEPDLPLDSIQSSISTWPEECLDGFLVDAAIAFAGGDFPACEQWLRKWLSPGGERALHPPTWRVLLDLYRAVGHRQRFDAAAADYGRLLGEAQPHWVSIPFVAKDPLATQSPIAGIEGIEDAMLPDVVLWACPATLEAHHIERLGAWAHRLQLARKCLVMDWSALQNLSSSAAQALLTLLQSWLLTSLHLRWKGHRSLIELLDFATSDDFSPAPERDFELHLACLRLLGRKDDYLLLSRQMVAKIDPNRQIVWELPARAVEEISDEFEELDDDIFRFTLLPGNAAAPKEDRLHLRGQVTAELPTAFREYARPVKEVSALDIDCAGLIRLDFMAAGELMNWALAQIQLGRRVRLVQVHRLVALFLFTMGLELHVPIEVRNL